MTSSRIEQLRNLREGYDLTAAVGFWKELRGEDIIEELGAAEARLADAQEALRQIGRESEAFLSDKLSPVSTVIRIRDLAASVVVEEPRPRRISDE